VGCDIIRGGGVGGADTVTDDQGLRRTAGFGPEIVPMLDDALEAVTSMVSSAGPDILAEPSRCRNWTGRDVVEHLVAVTHRCGRLAGGENPPADLGGSRWWALDAWRRHPEVLDRTCRLSFGSFDGATVAAINVFDATVHHWDISGRLPDRPGLIAASLAVARLLITDQARQSGQYGPVLVPPPGASDGARLLALTGRRPI
jgi:uncharacterized protein (TIGR03086 family)